MVAIKVQWLQSIPLVSGLINDGINGSDVRGADSHGHLWLSMVLVIFAIFVQWW